jgi:hypothetical protein
MEHGTWTVLKGESLSAKANVLASTWAHFIQTSWMEPDDYTINIDGYDGQESDPASIEEAHQLLREEQVQSIQPVYMWKEKMAPKWHPHPTRGDFMWFSGKHHKPNPGGALCLDVPFLPPVDHGYDWRGPQEAVIEIE